MADSCGGIIEDVYIVAFLSKDPDPLCLPRVWALARFLELNEDGHFVVEQKEPIGPTALALYGKFEAGHATGLCPSHDLALNGLL